MEITALQIISLLHNNTKIIVRRAFGDDDERQYRGLAINFPEQHQYANRPVIMITPWSDDCGDVCSIEDADVLDIAVGDFSRYDKFMSCEEYQTYINSVYDVSAAYASELSIRNNNEKLGV